MSITSVKIYLAVIALTAIGAFSIGAWLLHTAVTPADEFASFPESGSGERPRVARGEMSIRASTGYVVMKDVLERPVLAYPGDVYVLYETTDFSIVYFAQAEQFLISLLNAQNLTASQEQAEARFLELTGISRTSACTVQVSVEIPFRVDFERSGEYELSFCGGSVLLE